MLKETLQNVYMEQKSSIILSASQQCNSTNWTFQKVIWDTVLWKTVIFANEQKFNKMNLHGYKTTAVTCAKSQRFTQSEFKEDVLF